MKNISNPLISPEASVLFATFSLWANGKRMPTNGSVEPLRDFLVPKVKKLILIDQLVPGEPDISYKIEEYVRGGKKYISHPMGWWYILLRPFLQLTNNNATQIPFKLRDFLSVIDWSFRDRTVYDWYIGLESINAIAGIVLRRLGRVRKVIYYVSDYSPNRYPAKMFNALYLALDRFSAKHSDYIWDVSRAMQPARIRAGLSAKDSAPIIHVPNGIFPNQLMQGSKGKRNPNSLVYMGTVGPENGPDVAIRALALLKKRYPRVSLDIIGGKEADTVWLLSLVSELKLEKFVVFHGFVPSSSDMANIMKAGSIGLAPYRAFPGSARWYGDAGKIRSYCAAGLAIVSSHVPPLGQEVSDFGAALVVKDDARSFAEAIAKLFENPGLIAKLRARAYLYASTNVWENQFANAFKKMKV